MRVNSIEMKMNGGSTIFAPKIVRKIKLKVKSKMIILDVKFVSVLYFLCFFKKKSIGSNILKMNIRTPKSLFGIDRRMQ